MGTGKGALATPVYVNIKKGPGETGYLYNIWLVKRLPWTLN